MINPDDLKPWRMYRGFEGGAVYVAEKDGCFYVIIDESTMASLLPEDELGNGPLVNVQKFASKAERAEYLRERFGTSGHHPQDDPGI